MKYLILIVMVLSIGNLATAQINQKYSVDSSSQSETRNLNKTEEMENISRWSQKNLLARNIHKFRNFNSQYSDILISKIYSKEAGDEYQIAVELNQPINSEAARIIFDIDTDDIPGLNYEISIDLANKTAGLFTLNNQNVWNNFKPLAESKVFVEKNWIEFNLPKKYFPQDKVFDAMIETFKNKNRHLDYVQCVFFSKSNRETAGYLKSLAPIVLSSRKPDASSIDIVIVSDGFTLLEKEAFIKLAKAYINDFFSNRTINHFKDDFTFSVVFGASENSGFYDARKPEKLDTLFRAGYGPQGNYIVNHERLLYALQSVKSVDVIWVIGNDEKNYTGTGGKQSIGGLCIMGSGMRAVDHETGHALALLKDEYENTDWDKTPKTVENFKSMVNLTVKKEWNLSSEKTFIQSLKWKWLYDFPQFACLAGIFEGGFYAAKDVFRSEEFCTMRSGNPFGKRFCMVCADHLAKVINELSGRNYNREEFFSHKELFNELDHTVFQYGPSFNSFKIVSHSPFLHGNKPEFSIDDKLETLYTANPVPAYLVLDIGKAVNIGAMEIFLAQSKKNDFFYRYSISISLDNSDYQKIYEDDGKKPFPDKPVFIEVQRKARYIRIDGIDSSPWHELLIKDFRIFSKDLKNKKLLDYESLKSREN